jgi:hypothetical protein
VQHLQPAAPWGRLKAIAAIVSALGNSGCAPLHEHSFSRFSGCSPISAESPERQLVEADIAAFFRTTPEAGQARFEVHDCQMDGQVHDGKTIILSARIARLPLPQRYFIIAHEFAHHRLDHQVQIGGPLAGIVSAHAGPGKGLDAAELAHRTEFEADAYAVRMMDAQGLDPEEAARLFDSMGAGTDSATHPAFRRRAQAIRDVIATLHQAVAPEQTYAGR